MQCIARFFVLLVEIYAATINKKLPAKGLYKSLRQ